MKIDNSSLYGAYSTLLTSSQAKQASQSNSSGGPEGSRSSDSRVGALERDTVEIGAYGYDSPYPVYGNRSSAQTSSGSTTSDNADNPLKNLLSGLVGDGTLTQEQEDAISEKLDATKSESSNAGGDFLSDFTGILDELVSEGTLTQEQAYTIVGGLQSAQGMPPAPPSGGVSEEDDNDPLKAYLESLVSDGTLTQEQLDAISEKLDATKSESSNAGGDFLSDFTGILDELVSEGTLTQEQADSITDSLPPPPADGMPPAPPPESASDEEDDSTLEAYLESLVSDGTLAQEQLDAILGRLWEVRASGQDN